MKKILLITFCFVYLRVLGQDPKKFLYETEKGYSYMDSQGKSIIGKSFTYAGRFFEDLATASENG